MTTAKAEKKTAKEQKRRTVRAAWAWAQPVCESCWSRLYLKTGRADPDNMTDTTCCFCSTGVGPGQSFLIRLNPGTVPYPSILKTLNEQAPA